MPLSVTYLNRLGFEKTAPVLSVYFDPRFPGYSAVRFLVEDRGHRSEPTVHSLPIDEIIRFHGTENERLRFWELHNEGDGLDPKTLAAAFANELRKGDVYAAV